MFKRKPISCFSILMTEKTSTKQTDKKTYEKKKTKTRRSKAKPKKEDDNLLLGDGIVIVDDDIEIDQDKVNEERRAYLEEARSQEAFD